MSLRPLLRLDDKVAAEGRRLQNIGGASMRGVGPIVLLTAAAVHLAILLLPSMRIRGTLPDSSPLPDLPLVWRPIPPATPSQMAYAPPAVASPPRAAARPEAAHADDPMPMRPLTLEPVLEPVLEFAMSGLPGALAVIIPGPDRPPPALEAGPSSRIFVGEEVDGEPILVERVPPVYPSAARTLRAEGRVTLALTVLADGTVGGVSVRDCSRKGLGFEAAAIAAAKRWRYEPARGQAPPRETIVTVQFRQQDERP